jgi:hypothetical protein
MRDNVSGVEAVRFNGWQRLWVVVLVLWAITVLLFGFLLWPTAMDVSHGDVFAQMQPDHVQKFASAQGVRGEGEDITDLFNKAGQSRTTVEVGGHTLTFRADVSSEDMNRVGGEYYAALRRVLSIRRSTFVGEAITAWIIPPAALYALGWAVAWIRRGFKE